MNVNHQITDLVQNVAATFGMHVTRTENTLPFKRQACLERLNVNLVLDIGANVGHYVAELRIRGYQGRVVSFEPIAAVFKTLQSNLAVDKAWSGLQLALGDHEGQAQIHVSENFVSSSLLKVTAASIRAAKATSTGRVEDITVATLDSVGRALFGPSDAIYMKVDVQGFEKQVLEGASRTLEQVRAIEVELSLVELYSGQTLLPEMFNLLARLGYRPAWLERGFKDPNSGHLLQMDGIFVKE